MLLVLAQDAVEVKTNDGAATPQVRLSVTSGATTADLWVKSSRLRFDTTSDGYLNISADAAGSPLAGDLRYSGGSVLYHDGSSWLTLATTTGTNASVLLAPAAAQTWTSANVGIFLNETGAGSPNLLQLQSGGTNQFVVSNAGNVTATGSLTVNGNTTLGDASADTITVTGRFVSSLLPSADATYALGSTTNRWTSLYLSGNVLDSGGAVKYVQNQSAAQQASSSYWISGTGRVDSTLTVGGVYSNVYATVIYATGGNIHVQGNEDANGQPVGTRTRLRVGNAWGIPGIYSDTNSNGTNQFLVLGASNGTVLVGPGGATAMNLQVPNGTTSISDGSAATPGLAFFNDPNTGLFRLGADQLALSTAGVERLQIDSSGRLFATTTNLVTYGTLLTATGGVVAGDNVLEVRIASGSGPGGNGIWSEVFGSGAWGVYGEQRDVGMYGVLGYDDQFGTYAGVYGNEAGGATQWAGYMSGKLRVTDSITIGSSSTRFGMQKVNSSLSGVLFSHPAASIGLSWDTATWTLTVTNSTGSFYDVGIQRTNEALGFSSIAADVFGNLALSSGDSNGVVWHATSVKEAASGPGFTFSGTGWSNNIQGLVIYWY